MDSNKIKSFQDITLPDWGPYTNKYAGISHLAEKKKGLRFDLSVIPGIFKRKIIIPNVKNWDPGFFPLESSPSLEYYCNRYELEWKDKIYCDISFSQTDENARLIRTEFVNNTNKKQNIILHYVAYMNFPKIRPNKSNILEPVEIELPENALWIDGLDYDVISYFKKRPTDNLVPDGLLRGEVRDSGFVNGSGLGDGFGKDKGDYVKYCISLKVNIDKAVIVFRYRIKEEAIAVFKSNGIINTLIEFKKWLNPGNEDFNIIKINVGDLKSGEYLLELTSMDNSSIEIDGFAILPESEVNKVIFRRKEWAYKPEIEFGLCCHNKVNSIILKYKDSENYYGIIWDSDKFEIRGLEAENFEDIGYAALHHKIPHDYLEPELFMDYKGSGKGYFIDIFLRYPVLEPFSYKIFYGLVCTGNKEQVKKIFSDFESHSYPLNLEDFYKTAKDNSFQWKTTTEGQKYLLSQNLLAAVALTNVFYPIYIRRLYTKQYVPNKFYESLYTWDAGFYGIGLVELDTEKAIECLNSYVTAPGDPHAAFIHHGSPVPVQIYLLEELWNKTQSIEMLMYFYPRLKQYHEFLCGKIGSSTTNTLKSGLLKTWDYFYNSGGWDDYPAQVYTHANKLEDCVTPVVNTAHAIRTAKILKMAAFILNIEKDISEYDDEIRMFSNALQKFSWDEQTGYFGYVIHEKEGRPYNILRNKDGINLNMGQDGITPLISGICTLEQGEKIIGNMFSNKHLWTQIGISIVDLSAPYYKDDGYWNGSVWMAYQWFLWKTMFDMGRMDLAFKIAKTSLDVWQNEVEDSYGCYEHFNIKSLRGTGRRNFSGLCSPVMNWFAAYFVPGTITCGFDTWIMCKKFKDRNSFLYAEIKFGINEICANVTHGTGLLIVMNPEYRYKVSWNCTEINYEEKMPGVLEMKLPCNELNGVLKIYKT